MASPAALGSKALRASRQPLRASLVTQRPASTSSIETGEAGGVKFASRDLPGPTTTLTVVSKAGSRYQPLPGFTDALEKFAFKVSTCVPRRTPRTDSSSQHRNAPHYELLEKSSYWVVKSKLTTAERTSFSARNSSKMTYHTSPNS